MQKVLLVLASFIAAGSGLVGIPVVARNGTEEQLALVSVLLMVSSVLGVLDPLRAPIVRLLSHRNGVVSAQGMLKLSLASLAIGAVLTAVVVGALLWMIPSLKNGAASPVLLFIGCVTFFLASPWWASLDVAEHVGTAQIARAISLALFLAVAVFTVLYDAADWLIPFGFFLCNVFFLVLLIAIRRKITPNVTSLSELSSTVAQSELIILPWDDFRSGVSSGAIKAVLDVWDRLVLSKFLPPAAFAAYASFMEIVSRGNMPVQLTTNYLYPKVCREVAISSGVNGGSAIRQLFFTGALVSVGFSALAAILYVWGAVVASVLLGAAYGEYADLLVIAVVVVGAYSSAFVAQSLCRAAGLFRAWELMLWVFGGCAVLTSVVGYSIESWVIVFFGIILAKSTGLAAVLLIASFLNDRAVWIAVTLMLFGGVVGVLLSFHSIWIAFGYFGYVLICSALLRTVFQRRGWGLNAL